jgi:hypothetical protein
MAQGENSRFHAGEQERERQAGDKEPAQQNPAVHLTGPPPLDALHQDFANPPIVDDGGGQPQAAEDQILTGTRDHSELVHNEASHCIHTPDFT